MGLFRRNKIVVTPDLDADVEARIKKHPKKIQKKLRMLYKDYKEGKLIFPEGYDKDKYLNKE
jgi:hypothetical protein